MRTPCQVSVTAGRFRDNRRGVIEVKAYALDLAQIEIHQAGHQDVPPTTTRILLAGDHRQSVIEQLRTLADHLEAVGDIDAYESMAVSS